MHECDRPHERSRDASSLTGRSAMNSAFSTSVKHVRVHPAAPTTRSPRTRRCHIRLLVLSLHGLSLAMLAGCGSPSSLQDAASARTLPLEQLQATAGELRRKAEAKGRDWEGLLVVGRNSMERAEAFIELEDATQAREAFAEAVESYSIVLAAMSNVGRGLTLAFPEKRAIGEVLVRDWGSDSEWERLALAQGPVSIPKGKEVAFEADPGFNDADAAVLAAVLPGAIQSLNLSECKLTDAGLALVGRCRTVYELSLYSSNVGDAGLAQITRMSCLRSLNLIKTHVTVAGMPFLKALPVLESLGLNESHVRQEGFLALQSCPRLKRLWAHGLDVDDVGLDYLSRLKRLEYLMVSGSRMTDLGLSLLSNLRNLEECVIQAPHVTADGVRELRKALPQCRFFANT